MFSFDFLDGHDFRFWATVLVASFLKWLFTPEAKQQTKKQAIAGIVAGAACAFYGVDYVTNSFEISVNDRDIVIIGLVFTGEHIVRTVFNLGPLLARRLVGISEQDYETYQEKEEGKTNDS